MYGNDYQITLEEENRRNPKNRFLGLFCHASEVDTTWGCKCPFWVGVVLLSIIVGIEAIVDIPIIKAIFFLLTWINFFTIFIILRIISDICAIIGIGYAIYSICCSHYKASIIAYYCLVATFAINTFFAIFMIVILFYGKYRGGVSFRILSWAFDYFFLLLFCWFLFCNMVNIGRINRQQTAANSFI